MARTRATRSCCRRPRATRTCTRSGWSTCCRPRSCGSSRCRFRSCSTSTSGRLGAGRRCGDLGGRLLLRGGRRLAADPVQPDPANKAKVLDTGLWRYTRHPNYFGDATVWWGLWVLSLGALVRPVHHPVAGAHVVLPGGQDGQAVAGEGDGRTAAGLCGLRHSHVGVCSAAASVVVARFRRRPVCGDLALISVDRVPVT